MTNGYGAWEPLEPDALPVVLAPVRARWWLAGGGALDRHPGPGTRQHDDIDVQILRRDHMHVREVLSDWDMHAADPPGGLRPWPVGEELRPELHDIWCRRNPDSPWAFQLMIADTEGDDWIYRRDPRIRRPLDELDGPATTDAMRVLAPEIQLLYKSKGLRPKDQLDYDAVAPRLTREQRGWLEDALRMVAADHPWVS